LSFAVGTGVLAVAYLYILLVPSAASYRPGPTSWVRTVSSAYVASACGALSQLFMKVLSMALHDAGAAANNGARWAILLHPVVGVSLVGVLLAAPFQLFLINNVLASSPVSYAVPVYQALLTLLTSAAGGLFFSEFAKRTLGANALYAGGALTSLAGLVVLGQYTDPTPSGQIAQAKDAEGGQRLRQPLILERSKWCGRSGVAEVVDESDVVDVVNASDEALPAATGDRSPSGRVVVHSA